MDKNVDTYPKGQTLYPITCAWCKREGYQNIVGWSTVKGSHGICKQHKRELVRQERGQR